MVVILGMLTFIIYVSLSAIKLWSLRGGYLSWISCFTVLVVGKKQGLAMAWESRNASGSILFQVCNCIQACLLEHSHWYQHPHNLGSSRSTAPS